MADERAVRQALDRSSEAIRIGQLQSLLRIEVELHEQTEREARDVKQGLIRLLETIAPDRAEAGLASGFSPEALSAKELLAIVQSRVAAPWAGGSPQGGDLRETGTRSKDYQALRRELGSAKEKLAASQEAADRLQRELDASREQNRFLLEERKRLAERVARFDRDLPGGVKQATEPAILEAVEAGKEDSDPSPSVQDPPQWLKDWQQQETFESDQRLLRLLGATGLSRRPAVEAALARELGIKETTRTIRSRIGRLHEEGLLEILRPWKQASLPICSRLPDLVKLSEKGRQAFGALAGHAPKAPDLELLTAKYSSPETALLVLVAADMLSANGYTSVEYAGGNVPPPADLRAQDPDGQPISVAVVRSDLDEAHPGKGDGRWLSLHELTGGNLYVICDSRACMFTVRNQINYALGSRPVVIHLTNLSELQAGKRGVGRSLWLEVRKRPLPDPGPQRDRTGDTP